MKPHVSSRAGLALISLLLLIAAILVIGGVIVYILVKICQRCLPPPPPPDNGGNRVEVDWTNPATTNAIPGALVLPAFQFPDLPAPRNATTNNPLGDAIVYLERTTNFIHWDTLLATNLSYQFCYCDDTNPIAPYAFYRMRVWMP